MKEQNFKYVPIESIKPYDRNPRSIPQKAIDAVAESIKQFGFRSPIIIDQDNVIIAGHTRLQAAKKLELKEVPTLSVNGMTPEQIKAYRLADNKTGELSRWDIEKLNFELDDISFDMSVFGFESDNNENETNKYTDKIKGLLYEPTGELPTFDEMYDLSKYNILVKNIKESDIADEEKNFLITAASRHIVFNYRNIANFYANANRKVQDLMEESALVIIDYNKAIENGFVELHNCLEDEFNNEIKHETQ